MAGLKKPKKKDTGNPSTVLVIFLVFFILLSIGLGVWGYYGYAGQGKLAEAAKNAQKLEQAAKQGEKFRLMLGNDLWLAAGLDPKLDPQQVQDTDIERQDFMNNNFGKYASEANKEPILKLMQNLQKELGFDPATKTYRTTLVDERRKLQDDVKVLEGKFAKVQEELKKKEEDFWATIISKQEMHHKGVTAKIDSNAAAVLAEAKRRGEQYAMLSAKNIELIQEVQKINQDKAAALEEKEREIRNLKKKTDELLAEKAEGAEGGRRAGGSGEFQPLVLDISTGRPLWDTAVGQLTKVDFENRMVEIEISVKDKLPPLKVGQTFNVFRRRGDGRAEGFLRATVEVFKPLTEKSAQARILSLYGKTREKGETQEIDLSKKNITEVEDYEIRGGDLLFNIFWGNSIAIAGPASMDGEIERSPTKQMDKLSEFVYFLNDRDIGVDAYVDLTTGELKGNITSRTRFLIFREPASNGKEEEADEVSKQIKESIKNLKAKAAEKGLLLISPQNFQFVIGYRRTRGLNTSAADLNRFIPRVPSVVDGSNSRQAPPAKDAPAKDAEPK